MKQNYIENLSKIIAKLPSMGPRISKRIVLHLASNKTKTLIPLINALQNLDQYIHHCQICGNLDEGDICHICLDETRDKSIICIVEEVADLWAIERSFERSKSYRGVYHVLNGKLSARVGQGIEDLSIDKLIKRIKENKIQEIIIATSATIDGQTTAHFLAEILKEYNIKISRLAHGIPVGSEIDYLDDGTISIALNSRKEV
ncbi:recombination protein RecR [Alphaproteobacteria bacterium]|nr:recombination protein RecR [Alphaproteobacteria bacterium]